MYVYVYVYVCVWQLPAGLAVTHITLNKIPLQ